MEKQKLIVPPLSGGYMLSSMLGIIISVVYVRKFSLPWAVAFSVVFSVMFLSAVKSMTLAEPDMFVELETKNKKKKAKS
ncbi:MAG: hypothetical protein V1859_04125 [archaeon]